MTEALSSLSATRLLELGGLKTVCSSRLHCVAHGMLLPCDLCDVEDAGAQAAAVCQDCGHLFEQGLAVQANRPCASGLEFSLTGKIAFEEPVLEALRRLELARLQRDEADRLAAERARAHAALEAAAREKAERDRRRAQRLAEQRAREREAERVAREAAAHAAMLRVAREAAERERLAAEARVEQQARDRLAREAADRQRAEASAELQRLARAGRYRRAAIGGVVVLAVLLVRHYWSDQSDKAAAVMASRADAAGAADAQRRSKESAAPQPTSRPVDPQAALPAVTAQSQDMAQRIRDFERDRAIAMAEVNQESPPSEREGDDPVPTPNATTAPAAAAPGAALPAGQTSVAAVSALLRISTAVNSLGTLVGPAVKAAAIEIDDASAALAALPRPARGDRKRARVLLNDGLTLMGQEGLAQLAVDALAKAHAADPLDVQITNDLAYAETVAGRFRDAADHLVQALSLAPNRTSAWVNVAELTVAADGTPVAVESAVQQYIVGYWFSGDRPKMLQYLRGKLASAPAGSPAALAATNALQRIGQRDAAALRP